MLWADPIYYIRVMRFYECIDLSKRPEIPVSAGQARHWPLLNEYGSAPTYAKRVYPMSTVRWGFAVLYNLYPSIKGLARQRRLHVPYKTQTQRAVTTHRIPISLLNKHTYSNTHTHVMSAHPSSESYATMTLHVHVPQPNYKSIVVCLNAKCTDIESV